MGGLATLRPFEKAGDDAKPMVREERQAELFALLCARDLALERVGQLVVCLARAQLENRDSRRREDRGRRRRTRRERRR